MVVKVKHSSNTGNTPVSLANGELALNAIDQLLYYRHANGALAILANGASLLTFATAQVSSNQNQIPANTSAYKVTFNSNDLLIGVSHTIGDSRIFVLSNGWYRITASGNYLKNTGGTTFRIVDCWVRRNNVDVTGTTTRTPILNAMVDIPMNMETLLRLNSNDYIELVQAIDSTTGGAGLRTAVGLSGAPDIRSASLSITKIAN